MNYMTTADRKLRTAALDSGDIHQKLISMIPKCVCVCVCPQCPLCLASAPATPTEFGKVVSHFTLTGAHSFIVVRGKDNSHLRLSLPLKVED